MELSRAVKNAPSLLQVMQECTRMYLLGSVSVTHLPRADYSLSVYSASGTEYGTDSPLEMLNALQSSRVKV